MLQSNKREWKNVTIIALLTAVLLFLPYLFGYLTTPPDTIYTHLIMNPEDSQTYWAKMQQGLDGSWLYTIPFTPEPHDGALIGIFYVTLGQLARVTGLSLTAVWHLSRFIADVILFFVTFQFVAAFTTDRLTRWTAYLLALFGSGLGWLLFALQQPYWLNAFPVDFKQPGAHLFFTALTFPHITLGTALILLSVLALRALTVKRESSPVRRKSWAVSRDDLRFTIYDLRKSWRVVLGAGLCNLLLGIVYPFLIYIVAVTAVLYWLYRVLQARRILWSPGILISITFLIPAPLYLYYLWVWQNNPVFRAWDVQAGTPSAPWPHYLLAFGPMLLLAGWHWWKRPSERSHFALLWAWVLAVALLLYAPLNPQRRFVQGVQVPLAILATAGLVHVWLPAWQQSRPWQTLVAHPRYETAKLRRFVIAVFLLFMSLSNIYLWLDVTRVAVLEQPDLFFRPTAEAEAADWIRQNAPVTAVVLGAYETGNYVAARTGQRVVLGHWAETVDLAQKETAVAQFYGAAEFPDLSPVDRRRLLAQWNVAYVWYGPREQALGNFNPATLDALSPAYRNDSITIYKAQH